MATNFKAAATGEPNFAPLQAIGRDVLAKNPHLKAVYVTTNGYVYIDENDAVKRARTLNNKHVEIVKKEE